MTKLTMTISELADTLGITVATVYRRKTRDSESLPKPLNIPGQKVLIWLHSDVQKWLARFSAEQQFVPEPKRRGRPGGPSNQRFKSSF